MCLAIVNRAGTIDREVFLNAADNNPHGMGMLYVTAEGKLEAHRQMERIFAFYDHYNAVRAATDLPILLHWRFATHGTKDLTNCHPFFVSDEVGFIHNGVIPYVPDLPGLSDTAAFCQSVLAPLRKNFFRNPGVIQMLEIAMGTHSKLCFLSRRGEVRIINEQLGKWYKDAECGDSWFSNSSGFYEGYYGQSVTYRAGAAAESGTYSSSWSARTPQQEGYIYVNGQRLTWAEWEAKRKAEKEEEERERLAGVVAKALPSLVLPAASTGAERPAEPPMTESEFHALMGRGGWIGRSVLGAWYGRGLEASQHSIFRVEVNTGGAYVVSDDDGDCWMWDEEGATWGFIGTWDEVFDDRLQGQAALEAEFLHPVQQEIDGEFDSALAASGCVRLG